MSARRVTLVGGGLAGLTLGIGLRQRGVPVELFDAGAYPRHRVCGEFISGHGLDVLAKLGLAGAVRASGAQDAVTAQFHAGATAGTVQRLPKAALCISRFTLDALLARRFASIGGELHCGGRWRGDAAGEGVGEGVVLASGRRAAPKVGGWKWFGLKAHARGVRLAAELEMHLTTEGYVGLCRVEDGCVNVCGLFRRRGDETELAPDWKERLSGEPDSILRERLDRADWVEESFSAVAGLDLRPRHPDPADATCRVGDALTMIPPFTGNGMSMALESAAFAMEPLARWSRGATAWSAAVAEIASTCEGAFRSRLRWAEWMHRALFVKPLQPFVVRDLLRYERLWRFLHARTRGAGPVA